MSSPEQLSDSGERSVEATEASSERLEALKNSIEKGAELGKEHIEQTVERAKVEAMETAIGVEKSSAEKVKKAPPAPRRHGVVSKKEGEQSFKRHMSHIQKELSAPSRAFSKLIHNKTVERTSDFVGATAARPDAILSGAVAAFFLVLTVYIIAKTLGYVLSGFETIAAFIIGWILGTVYDYFKVLITGKSQ